MTAPPPVGSPTNCSAPRTRPSAPLRSGSPPASPCTTAARRRRPTCSVGSGRIPTPSSAPRARSSRSPPATSRPPRAALSAESAGPPKSTARAARSLAEGLVLSLDQPFPIAVARLGQSITAEQQSAGVAPDTPAALVTLAALHGGDPVRARSCDRPGRARRKPGGQRRRVLRCPPAPPAARLGADAGRATGRGRRRRRLDCRCHASPP